MLFESSDAAPSSSSSSSGSACTPVFAPGYDNRRVSTLDESRAGEKILGRYLDLGYSTFPTIMAADSTKTHPSILLIGGSLVIILSLLSPQNDHSQVTALYGAMWVRKGHCSSCLADGGGGGNALCCCLLTAQRVRGGVACAECGVRRLCPRLAGCSCGRMHGWLLAAAAAAASRILPYVHCWLAYAAAAAAHAAACTCGCTCGCMRPTPTLHMRLRLAADCC
jgi:hypothetical protein